MGGEEDDGNFNPSDPRSIQMGLSSMFRTGNHALDMIIAMSIPMALKILMDSSGWMQNKLIAVATWVQQNDSFFERHIVRAPRAGGPGAAWRSGERVWALTASERLLRCAFS
jgi:hypothetical protein